MDLCHRFNTIPTEGFSHSSVHKSSACNAGDLGSVPELGRSPGEVNGNPLQYSCLENPMDRGAWRATVHGITRVGHDLVTKPPQPPAIKPYQSLPHRRQHFYFPRFPRTTNRTILVPHISKPF